MLIALSECKQPIDDSQCATKSTCPGNNPLYFESHVIVGFLVPSNLLYSVGQFRQWLSEPALLCSHVLS